MVYLHLLRSIGIHKIATMFSKNHWQTPLAICFLLNTGGHSFSSIPETPYPFTSNLPVTIPQLKGQQQQWTKTHREPKISTLLILFCIFILLETVPSPSNYSKDRKKIDPYLWIACHHLIGE